MNREELLKKIKELKVSSIERAILLNEDQVQGLLSNIFVAPIYVEVLSQVELNGSIIRWSRLVAEDKTVCLAQSVIPIDDNPNGLINGIREKTFGIGQLLEATKIITYREILGMYADDNVFSRSYKLKNNVCNDQFKVCMIITELFPKECYKGLS